MADKRPPKKVTLTYCPECGRTDRFRPFLGRGHYIGSRKCPGTLRKAEYVLR